MKDQKLEHQDAQLGTDDAVQSELERRARILSEVPKEDLAESDRLNLLTIPLGDMLYAVEARLVQEVRPLKPGSWSRVPCTPDFIHSVVNIRGRLYSVTDIARFLGLPERPLSENAHVLLVGEKDRGAAGAMEFAILADDMPQVASVRWAEVQPSTGVVSSRAQPYMRGVTDDMLMILDLERLLSDPKIVVHEEV